MSGTIRNSEVFDFIIVGSGVAGGRIADRLCAAGARCLLVEAGSRYTSQSFPENEMLYSARMFWGGGLEMSADARLGFLRGRCYGGSSLINNALLDKLPEEAMTEWNDESGLSLFKPGRLQHYYDKATATMCRRHVAAHEVGENGRIFNTAMASEGIPCALLQRAEKDCARGQGSDCLRCMGGCRRGAKQSTAVTCLPRAESNGLAVVTEALVHTVLQRGNLIEVTASTRGPTRVFRGRNLVLAGGAFGNTRLLLRSGWGEQLPMLGKRISCHPQYVAFGLFDAIVDAHKGAFQSLKSADPDQWAKGYKFENMFAPPIATAMLLPGFGRSAMRIIEQYRNLAAIECAIRDDSDGVILYRSGRFQVRKRLTKETVNRRNAALVVLKRGLRAAGARAVFVSRQGFGLHLMGGCRIGNDRSNSVVGPQFRIHGVPNAYIADSSVFPTAPGVNPSLTVMAIAEMAAERILKR